MSCLSRSGALLYLHSFPTRRSSDLVSQLPDGFLYMGAAILCAALAAGLFAWVGGVGISRITETLIAEIREENVGAALRLPRATIDTTGTGDVVTRPSDAMAQLSGTLPG